MRTFLSLSTITIVFLLQMKEAQYVLRSVTSTSLIVLDELCKGTAIDEGASIAWAICERLSNTTAFVFAATHFVGLTKLADVYCNVKKYARIRIHLMRVNVYFFLRADKMFIGFQSSYGNDKSARNGNG